MILLQTAPKKQELPKIRQQRSLVRGINLRANANVLSPASFQARKAYMVSAFQEGKFLAEPEARGKPRPNPMSDPAAMEGMMGMMKGNMAMMIPQTLIMGWINAFFSGFVISEFAPFFFLESVADDSSTHKVRTANCERGIMNGDDGFPCAARLAHSKCERERELRTQTAIGNNGSPCAARSADQTVPIRLSRFHRVYPSPPRIVSPSLANDCCPTVKLPFPLTPQFKSMLQSGVGTRDLDVRWVSSLSWYFLTLFGLQPVYNFILGSNNCKRTQPRLMGNHRTVLG